MSKTITVSDETYKIIKEQVESENVKEKFEIKNRFTGDVIYTSEKTNCKDAIEEAVKNKADLREANLREANLCEADLREANLCGADLCEADLCEANLREANLYGANLYRVDLRGADLYGANLYGADLRGARFYGKGGTTKIKKDQVNDFLTALGIVVSK